MKIVWQKGKMNVPKEYDQNEGLITATLAKEMLKDAFLKYGWKLIAMRVDEKNETCEYEYKALMAFALNPKETDQSADYQPLRHAHWIERARYGENETSAICECSACGDTVWTYDDPARRWKYCPQCGAKMDEEEARGSGEKYEDDRWANLPHRED